MIKKKNRLFRHINQSPTFLSPGRSGNTSTTIFYGFAKSNIKGKNQFLRKFVTKSDKQVTSRTSSSALASNRTKKPYPNGKNSEKTSRNNLH